MIANNYRVTKHGAPRSLSGNGITKSNRHAQGAKKQNGLGSGPCSTKPLEAPLPTNARPKQKCPCCRGTGEVEAEGLLLLIQSIPKPRNFVDTLPGAAPDDHRWICPFCKGYKQVKKSTNDLRVHLKNNHGYDPHEIEIVFDPKNGFKWYNWFGPCNERQAAANGWEVKSWMNKKKHKNTIEVASVAFDEDDIQVTERDASQPPRLAEREPMLDHGAPFRQFRVPVNQSIRLYGVTPLYVPNPTVAGPAIGPPDGAFQDRIGVNSDASNGYFGVDKKAIQSQDRDLSAAGTVLDDRFSEAEEDATSTLSQSILENASNMTLAESVATVLNFRAAQPRLDVVDFMEVLSAGDTRGYAANSPSTRRHADVPVTGSFTNVFDFFTANQRPRSSTAMLFSSGDSLNSNVAMTDGVYSFEFASMTAGFGEADNYAGNDFEELDE